MAKCGEDEITVYKENLLEKPVVKEGTWYALRIVIDTSARAQHYSTYLNNYFKTVLAFEKFSTQQS